MKKISFAILFFTIITLMVSCSDDDTTKLSTEGKWTTTLRSFETNNKTEDSRFNTYFEDDKNKNKIEKVFTATDIAKSITNIETGNVVRTEEYGYELIGDSIKIRGILSTHTYHYHLTSQLLTIKKNVKADEIKKILSDELPGYGELHVPSDMEGVYTVMEARIK